jgi:hypothetical protein
MLNIYEEYRIVIFSVLGLITFALSIYFYINRNKQPWFSYYWKGFCTFFILCVLTLVKVVGLLHTSIESIAKILVLLILLIGFYLIIVGAKLERKVRKHNKREKRDIPIN